jgi:hypothetical protein
MKLKLFLVAHALICRGSNDLKKRRIHKIHYHGHYRQKVKSRIHFTPEQISTDLELAVQKMKSPEVNGTQLQRYILEHKLFKR